MDEKRAMEIFMEQRKKWARNMGLLIQGRKITIGDVETGNQLEVDMPVPLEKFPEEWFVQLVQTMNSELMEFMRKSEKERKEILESKKTLYEIKKEEERSHSTVKQSYYQNGEGAVPEKYEGK